MSKVPKASPLAANSAEATLADFRAEFPGWTIDAPWSACREDGHGVSANLTASSFGELRAALDEVDAVDCRRAITELAETLLARGLKAQMFGLTMHTQTRARILRVVAARRGFYTWTTSVVIGPINDSSGAAERMLPGLGLT